jgi:hypothetical protein
MGEFYIGWELVIVLALTGVAAKFLAAVRRRFVRRDQQGRGLAPPGGRQSVRADGSFPRRML